MVKMGFKVFKAFKAFRHAKKPAQQGYRGTYLGLPTNTLGLPTNTFRFTYQYS